MYGPSFPLHNERYFKSRVLPKLLDERAQMFRFYSCKFRIEKSKLKAARVVLFREFGIMNCFTLEASFHGYIEKDRSTQELMTEDLEEMGKVLGNGFNEYFELVENDDRQKQIIRERLHNKKRKMKARDITLAIIKKEKADKENVEDQFASDTGDDINSQNSQKTQHFKIQKGLQGFQSHLTSAKSDSDEVLKRTNRTSSLQRSIYDHNQSQTLIGTQGQTKTNIGYMELISEEELSVCRSEGSPTKKKRRQEKEVQNAKKAKLKEKKQLRLISKEKDSEFPPKRTLSQLYNDIKNPISTENQNKCEGDSDLEFQDEDDVSSCDQSFNSADDLSEADLQNLQGNILDVIKQFDKIYNPTVAQQEKEHMKEKMRRKQKLEKMKDKDKDKDKEREKKKKKKTKEEKQKTKDLPPVGLPFQAKLTGNGGNPCTLVMEKIFKERQDKALMELKNIPFISTSKKISQSEFQNVGQQILKIKKTSQQPIHDSSLGRANPQYKVNQVLKPEKEKSCPFRARNSQTDLKDLYQDTGKIQSMTHFGVKGLAALSDLRKQMDSQGKLNLAGHAQENTLPSDTEPESRILMTHLSDNEENNLKKQNALSHHISVSQVSQVENQYLNDPKIIFASQESNLQIKTNEINDRRSSQEGIQYRLRSGRSKPTFNKAQNTTINPITSQIQTNSKNNLIIKARSTSGGIKQTAKNTTTLKVSNQMLLNQLITPKQTEGQNSPRSLAKLQAMKNIQSPAVEDLQTYKVQFNANHKMSKQALFLYGSAEQDQKNKPQSNKLSDFEIKRVSKNKSKNESSRQFNMEQDNSYKESTEIVADQGPLTEIQNTLKQRQKKHQKTKISMHPNINQPGQEVLMAFVNSSSRVRPLNTSHEELAPPQLQKNTGFTNSQQRIFNMQKYTTIASKTKQNKRRNILKDDNFAKDQIPVSMSMSNAKCISSEQTHENNIYN